MKFIFNWAFCIFSGNRSPRAKVKTQKNEIGPLRLVALLSQALAKPTASTELAGASRAPLPARTPPKQVLSEHTKPSLAKPLTPAGFSPGFKQLIWLPGVRGPGPCGMTT